MNALLTVIVCVTEQEEYLLKDVMEEYSKFPIINNKYFKRKNN